LAFVFGLSANVFNFGSIAKSAKPAFAVVLSQFVQVALLHYDCGVQEHQKQEADGDNGPQGPS
jgi:hypothetical protein